jgi:hypothetical protein
MERKKKRVNAMRGWDGMGPRMGDTIVDKVVVVVSGDKDQRANTTGT